MTTVLRRYDCNPKSSPGKRWYPDHCDGENLNHLYACQVPRGKQLNLTNIFHREYIFIFIEPYVSLGHVAELRITDM